MSRPEKKQKLLDTALSLFAIYGFKKTTVSDVADAMGMTKGNLYLYVKDKRDLYDQTVLQAMTRWQQAAMDEALKHEDAIKKLEAYATAGFSYLAEHPKLKTILANDPALFPYAPSDDKFLALNKASMLFLKGVIDEGIRQNRLRQVESQKVSELMYAVYTMMIIKVYIQPDDQLTRDMIVQGLDVILNGLKA